MKKETKIIANYSQKGHPHYPEDTWDASCIISGSNSLFWIMKDWFKSSARSFNNYPFSGLFACHNITFEKIDVITDDDGKSYSSRPEPIEAPEYYEECVKKFEEWYKRMEHLLPYWKKRRDKRATEFSEREKYEYLKNKYGN